MYSSNKGKHGKVQLNVINGKYYLRLPKPISRLLFDQNDCARISLRINESQANLPKAIELENKIQSYIDNEQYQAILEFKAELDNKNKVVPLRRYSLLELWNEYVERQKSKWSPSYIAGDIQQTEKHLNAHPVKNPDSFDEILAFRDYLEDTCKTHEGLKRYLKQVSSCLDFWVRNKRITVNHAKDLLKDINPKKQRQYSNDDNEEHLDDINPFNKEQKDAIIYAFKTNQFSRYQGCHSKYAPYVEFLFLTGCRTSEALGLRFSDISEKEIFFRQGKVLSNRGLKNVTVKKGLKTQNSRKFPVTPKLRELLETMDAFSNNSNDELFKNINHNSFRTPWKYVLRELKISYRKPYCTRHTFISLQLNDPDSKMKEHQIAELVGTSTDMIRYHYLGKTGDYELTDI
ncbi:MAG: tyrosine-type recombinase/integrase [Snowella sp.]|nr:tyrosine-type recombinase/integrase [Snowella sp.]